MRLVRNAVVWCVLGVAWGVVGCGGGPSPTQVEGESLVDISAVVDGPVPNNAVVQTAVGSWTIGSGGAVSLDIPSSGGTQIALVETPDGDPMMLGWLDESRKTINARTTAEVITYYALGGFMFPLDNQITLIEALEAEPALADLAATIESAIEQDQTCLVTADSSGAQAIQAQLAVLADELRGKYGPDAKAQATDAAGKLAISPSDQRSGVRVLNDSSTVNTIEIINEYRRRGYVYIEQTSWVRESDGVVVTTGTTHDASPFWLSPTRGVGDGAIAVTEDIFQGIYDVGSFAYEPISAGLLDMTVPDEASKATYTITIIGPGTGTGDVADLTSDQTTQLVYVSGYALVADVIVPAIMNVAVPIKTYSGGATDLLDELMSGPTGATALEDMVNIIIADPNIVTDLTGGQFVPALKRSWQEIVLGGTFQAAAKNFVTYAVMALNNRGLISAAQMEGAMHTTYSMGRVLNGLALVDIILGAGDVGVVVAHIGLSDLANIYTVEALPPEVTLLPETTRMDPFDTVTLTAAVPELTGSTSTAEFTYHWSCTGNHGTITDSIGHTGIDFDSSSDFVAYIAETGTNGGDTVTVTVTQVRTSGSGTSDVEIGDATATICVGDNCTWVTPDEANLQAGTSVTIEMNVLVDEDTGDPADLTYEWTCDEQAGAITAGGSATDTTLTYRANFLASAQTETVTAEAFLPDDHGALESVGAATATLTIAPPTIEIDPVIVTLAPDQSATLTASVTPEPDTTLDGIVTYAWTCTDSHGTLAVSNDTATYTAGTSSTGTDEVEANVTLSPPTGAAFALGFAGVDVVVDAGTPGVPFALEILGKPSQTLPDGSVVDVRVRVTDGVGDPVASAEIAFDATGVAHLSDTSGISDSDGEATVQLISDSVGSVIVTASASPAGSDSAMWVFGAEVTVSPSDGGALLIDNDTLSMTMSVSPAVSGAQIDYIWGYPMLPMNWSDYVGDLESDDALPSRATLYAGWAPGGRTCLLPKVYAYYGDQQIDLGGANLCFETTYDPESLSASTWSETEDIEATDTVTLYKASVYGGFQWSGAADRQYRYFVYTEGHPENRYGQAWSDTGIVCDDDSSGVYRVLLYSASTLQESEADRTAWISEQLVEAEERIETNENFEYHLIAQDWPPAEEGCR